MNQLHSSYKNSINQLGDMPRTLAFAPVRAHRLEGRTSSFEELDAIQDTFSPQLKIDHPEDGCYARAQLLSEELRRKGLSHGKLFVHSTYKSLAHEDVRWNYHVAAVALAETETGPEVLVLDPTLSEDPLPPTQWLKKFQNNGHVVVTLHDDRKYQNGLWGSRDFENNTQQAKETLGAM